MSDFFLRYVEKLKSVYPLAGLLPDLEDRLKFLISSHVLNLPKSVADRVGKTIHDIYAYAHGEAHQKQLQEKLPPELNELLAFKAKNAAVLMAYDFHYDPNTDLLGLIEINTNASAYLLADLLYKTDKTSSDQGSLSDLNMAFKSELEYGGKNTNCHH
jgi:hypothetical protein